MLVRHCLPLIRRVFDLSQQPVLMPAADLHDTSRLDRVWKELHRVQHSNLKKVARTAFRYNSELALDLSFEIWFHGGTIAHTFVIYSLFTYIAIYQFRTCGSRFLGENAICWHIAAALYDANTPNGQVVTAGGAWLFDGALCACGAIHGADGLQASDLHKLQ
jgi:hypothetical protein